MLEAITDIVWVGEKVSGEIVLICGKVDARILIKLLYLETTMRKNLGLGYRQYVKKYY